MNLTLKKLKILFIFILLLSCCLTFVSAAQWEVGEGQTYKTIQSAVDNVNTSYGDIINVHNGTYYEDIIIYKNIKIQSNKGDTVEINPVNTGFTIKNDSIGDGSGSSIVGFKIINSLGGTGINISANNCDIRNNQINNGSIGIFVLANNSLLKNNTICNVLEKGIQLGNFIDINESGTIKNIKLNSNNGTLEDNQIIGVSTGIDIIGDNSIVRWNKISQLNESGIKIFGSSPKILENTVKDIVGKGSKAAIQIASINLEGSTGLLMSGNIISNIKSTNDTVAGIDSFIMSMNSTLEPVLILNNSISDISGFGKITGTSVVPLSLGGPLSVIDVSNNKITNFIGKGENNTITAISLIPMGFENKNGNNTTTSADKLSVSKNNIAELTSDDLNSAVKGISLVQLFSGNSSISENTIKNLKTNAGSIGISVTGVDYTKFNSNITINKNNINNLSSEKLSSGIESINIGNTNIFYNIIFNLKSPKTKYLAAVTVLNSTNTIIGNNLEGNGVGEGISVMGNNNIINYNRIVNFTHNIENINFSELFEFSQGRTLPSDKEIREYLLSKNGTYVNGTLINITEEDVINVINAYHKLIDNLNNLTKSKTDAKYNWHGTNKANENKFINGNGTLIYSPWLILKINADPSEIKLNQKSNITANVFTDSNGNYHGEKSAMFFTGPKITFRTNLGNIGSKFITADWINGFASAILRGDEGYGIATVSATDYETVKTNVNILKESNNNTTPSNNTANDVTKNNTAHVVPMENTGIPLFAILLLVVAVALLGIRRK